ncbi:Hsp70 family protein [Nocardia beijingensis]|uniref:Hsp70 family protein n=1 Tax=Nocardia beijingensis TaxID=95162 RepID=UPI000A939072|nr:Hsp70 family protein [Nocardia beijingensis]
MTTGLGFSIGAVNSVTASVSADRPRPAVRSRRTAVTFDSAGGLRLGGIARFDMAVTDFADLSRDPDAVIVGGRIWSPANLVAAVVKELRAAEPGAAEAGVVTTYPAVYSDKQVALLRQALDLSGAGDVLLVPEPVAAAEWLEHEHGPLETEFVLVYDLGGTSLDVSIVRVGPDWDDHPMIGKPVRSHDFGGRPLGSMIARYAPDVASAGLPMTSIVDIDGLRAAHVQDSLQLVRDCVREAGITLSDIGRVLVVGGASRPAEVARTLAELGRPVLISADPGQTIAAGAALMAARTMALGASDRHSNAPRVAVFSSAAVVSAVAMSAVTVFGGPTAPELAPMLERLPELGAPADSLLVDVGSEQLAEAWSRISAPALWASGRALPSLLSQPTSAYTRFITPAPRSADYGPSVAESRIGSHRDPRNCCAPGGVRYRGYGDPAYFVNPLPFGPVVLPGPGDIAQQPTPGQPPNPGQGPGPGLPGQPPAPGQVPAPGSGAPPVGAPEPTIPAPQNGSKPAEPGGTAPGSSAGSPSTGTSGSPGAASGEHNASSSSASGAASTGDSSSGGGEGTSTGGTSSEGSASSGGSANDSTAHGSSADSSHGSSGGSPGGSAGGSSGGASGNSTTHGSSSGGSAGNSSSESGSSAHGSSSAGAAGDSSAHGSSPGGSAGNSATGGSASNGRPGASSAGGHAGGNSSGASSSSGSPGRAGSVGGASAGGSSRGGAGGAGGGGRGR